MYILAENTSLRIVQFKACGHIGLMYNNILLSMTTENFFNFVNTCTSVDFEERSILFIDDEKRIIIDTIYNDIQFCFSRDEFEMLNQALGQASILLRARLVIEDVS